MRTFVAIELPPQTRAALSSLQRELTPHTASLKVVDPELLHLTVRFLGDVPARRIDAVRGAVEQAARMTSPFALTLERVGAFGGRGGVPRVVWAGLQEDGGLTVLKRVHQALEGELARAGFEREQRPYAPHLTLARVREGLNPPDGQALRAAVDALARSHTLCASFEVRTLTVMRSDLARSGPRYTPLARVPLGEKEAAGA